MNPTSPAVIAFRRAADMVPGSLRSFSVWIDGRRARRVKRGMPAEFPVEQGEHTVAVSYYWYQSRPYKVHVEPQSRTELALGIRSNGNLKVFLPMLIAPFVTWVLMLGLQATTTLSFDHWLLWALSLVGTVAVFAGYVLVTLKFAGDYWAIFTLGPAGAGLPKEPVWE